MNVIEEEKLQENALCVGKYLLEQSKVLESEFELVGDVRGSGLFIGVELVLDRKVRSPATKEAKFVVDRMKNVHKILVSSDGPDDNVIKLKPPMVFSIENADEFLYAFRECLSQLEKQDKTQTDKTNLKGSITNPVMEKREHAIKSV